MADPEQADAGPADSTISPDDEARMAFQSTAAAAQERSQTQSAFDTGRQRMAFISGLLAGGPKARQALRSSSLSRGLEGASPTPTQEG